VNLITERYKKYISFKAGYNAKLKSQYKLKMAKMLVKDYAKITDEENKKVIIEVLNNLNNF
jgi:polyhydroxyalkanoate synthesis regulator phasin